MRQHEMLEALFGVGGFWGCSRVATWAGPEVAAEAQVGAVGFIFMVEPLVEVDTGRWTAT